MISNVLVYLQILPLIGKTCININSMGLQMGAIVETLAIIVLNITIFIDHLYKVIAIIIKQEPTVTESILLFNLLISHIYLIRLLVLEEKKESVYMPKELIMEVVKCHKRSVEKMTMNSVLIKLLHVQLLI